MYFTSVFITCYYIIAFANSLLLCENNEKYKLHT